MMMSKTERADVLLHGLGLCASRAEAGKLRAEGEREAQRIRDDVLVKCEEIRRQGREESGKIVGQAEKEAAEIYARAHRLDPEFYRFWRSLQAIQKTLGTKATVILRTDQGFFDVLAAPPKHLHAPQPSSESPAARATPPPREYTAGVNHPRKGRRRDHPGRHHRSGAAGWCWFYESPRHCGWR